ncbi:MAG: hypothetical protein U0176_00645 [Bacteroidia bacterium]
MGEHRIKSILAASARTCGIFVALIWSVSVSAFAQDEPVNYEPEEQTKTYRIEMSAPDALFVRWNRLYSSDSISVLQGGRLICKFAYDDEKPMIIELGNEVFRDGRPLHFQGELHELVCFGRQYFRVADVPVSIPKHKKKLPVTLEHDPLKSI